MLFRMTIVKHHPGHQALRKGRVSIPNQIYLITVCCNNKEKLFLDENAARVLSSTLHRVLQNQNSKILAWVVMPDHMHLALQLGEHETLGKTMNRINSCSAIAINKVIKRHSPVWQGAYHDHALRDDEQLFAAIKYLISNPIRAGLVERLGDYPYWNIGIAEPSEALLF
ncbi:MAG: REP-associated tyrosine transposase [Arenimonas sp.]